MRITAKVLAAGERWAVEFPHVDFDECFPEVDGKRVAQPDAVRRILDQGGITHAKDDTSYLQCLVAQFVAKMGDWKDRNEIGKDADGYERSVERMGRRFERGQVTYARATFRNRWDGDKLIVSFDCECDDRGVVEKRRWEELWMWLMSEAAHIVSEECTDCGYHPIEFSERAEAAYSALLAWRRNEAHRKVVEWARMRRTACKCHHNGYCSPCHPKCRFYREGGKCCDIETKGE